MSRRRALDRRHVRINPLEQFGRLSGFAPEVIGARNNGRQGPPQCSEVSSFLLSNGASVQQDP